MQREPSQEEYDLARLATITQKIKRPIHQPARTLHALASKGKLENEGYLNQDIASLRE